MPKSLETGASIGRYQLVERLNRGGMGELWRAKATGPAGFDKTVVLKTIRFDLAGEPSYERLFVNEARIMARLSHPNVVQVFDLGKQDGVWYMAMEMVEGFNLRHLLRTTLSKRRLPPVPAALRIVRCVAEALVSIHAMRDEQGRFLEVVHRDINPDNILISYAGTTKLCDFGIAKAHWNAGDAGPVWTQGIGIGKLAYLAPEQVGSQGRRVDARTDIFSLGVTLYELLTGKQPFWRPDKKETLAAIVAGDMDAPTHHAPWLSSRIEKVVLKAVSVDPRDRYQSAREFAMALDALLARMPVYPYDDIMAAYLQGLYAEEERGGPEVMAGEPGRLRPDMLTPAPGGRGAELAVMGDGFSGRLDGLDIFEFLQMVLVSRRRTVLEVVNRDGEVARLFVADGNVVHAECCGTIGRDAFIGCLAFSGGAFSTHPWEEPAEHSISEPGEFLLLDAARLKDEAERQGGSARQIGPSTRRELAQKARLGSGREAALSAVDRQPSGGVFEFADVEEDDGAGPSRHQAAVLFEKGWQLLRQRDYEAAMDRWKRAVELDPENRSYRTNLEILEKRMQKN